MSQPDIYWTGQSGRNYGYWIHPIEASFRKIAGNVIFARQSEAGEWEPVYIGQAHVHFSSPGDAVRKAEVTDLVAKWNPVCNI
jgi:hypothetical protein